MRKVRKSLLACLVAAVGAGALPVVGVALPDDPLLPDLVPDAPTVAGGAGDNGLSVDGSGASARLLLRFDGYVHNAGPGVLEVADNVNDGQLNARQVVYRSGVTPGDPSRGQTLPLPSGLPSGPRPGGLVFYESADGHNHWHVYNAAMYSLWNEQKTAPVAPASKVGFCMYDSQRVSGGSPQFYDWGTNPSFCQAGHSGAVTVMEGVSPGWRDIYSGDLALQWVDVSRVPPGIYWLASAVDPNNFIREANEGNNGTARPAFAGTPDVVPGYVAKGLTIQPAQRGAPIAITLAADTYSGSPSLGEAVSGQRRFRIVAPPSHGTLGVAPGTAFPASQIVYTPAPGSAAADSFSYVALDAASPFPRNPVEATVSIAAAPGPPPAPTLSLAGPPVVLAGTAVPLEATGSGEIAWSVEGIPGGDPTVGTVTPTGPTTATYLAPAVPPPSGGVRVRAASASGASAELVMAIQAQPPPQPAPVPGGPTVPPSVGGPTPDPPREVSVGNAKARIVRARVQLRGRTVLVRATPTAAGAMRTVVLRDGRGMGSCRTKSVKGRAVSCRVTIRRGHLRNLRVVIQLQPLAGGKRVLARLNVRR